MTCTLVASVIVSFTFMPLIAYYLIKPPKQAEQPMSERRTHGFPGLYYQVGDFALGHRWGVFAGSLLFLVLGGVRSSKCCIRSSSPRTCRTSPTWMSGFRRMHRSGATRLAAKRAETVIREEAERFGKEHHEKDVLK